MSTLITVYNLIGSILTLGKECVNKDEKCKIEKYMISIGNRHSYKFEDIVSELNELDWFFECTDSDIKFHWSIQNKKSYIRNKFFESLSVKDKQIVCDVLKLLL